MAGVVKLTDHTYSSAALRPILARKAWNIPSASLPPSPWGRLGNSRASYNQGSLSNLNASQGRPGYIGDEAAHRVIFRSSRAGVASRRVLCDLPHPSLCKVGG